MKKATGGVASLVVLSFVLDEQGKNIAFFCQRVYNIC